MSASLKNRIFYVQSYETSDVIFFKVVRSTTNTCEVVNVKKTIVFQNEDVQYVEPDLRREGLKERCKVLNDKQIKFKDGDIGTIWDGKPVKQICIIYMPIM